jgi:transcription-repair coupling factor (superfamily II helicase)
MEPGEYAVRGGIIDVFPSGEGDPVRLDFFGDTVESVRRFDPATQRSTEKAAGFSLRPVSEVTLDAESVARFRTAWRDLYGQAAASDPIYQAISDGALGATIP